MKPLLAILGSLTVGVSPALATISTNPAYNKNTQPQNAIWKQPDSVATLMTGLDNYHRSKHLSLIYDDDFSRVVKSFYSTFFDNVQGSLSTLEVTPENETVDETFEDVYVNNTPNTQTFLTHSYSRQVTNTTTFNIKLQEEISVSATVSFIFGSTTIKAGLSSDQTWTDTTTTTETITAPSQSIVVSPYSRGVVRYSVKSGTYNVLSSLRIRQRDGLKLFTSYMKDTNTGVSSRAGYDLPTIVQLLNQAGHGDFISFASHQFSVISADTPSDPKQVTFNLPVEYTSKGGQLEVDFSEQPLN